VKISRIFVAFSEYMNFNWPLTSLMKKSMPFL
jgi:hypothetical protein